MCRSLKRSASIAMRTPFFSKWNKKEVPVTGVIDPVSIEI
jgi:hypothetical protein